MQANGALLLALGPRGVRLRQLLGQAIEARGVRQRQAGVSGEFDARAMTWVVETQGTIYSLGFKFMLNLCE